MPYKVKNISGKTITFDFDGTLDDDFDGTHNPQKKEIQDILTQLKNLGNKIIIVTKRYSPELNSDEYKKVYKLASFLGIQKNDIVFTNRDYKIQTLMNIGSDIHFENCFYETQHADKFKHKINWILIEDPYWRDKIYA